MSLHTNRLIVNSSTESQVMTKNQYICIEKVKQRTNESLDYYCDLQLRYISHWNNKNKHNMRTERVMARVASRANTTTENKLFEKSFFGLRSDLGDFQMKSLFWHWSEAQTASNVSLVCVWTLSHRCLGRPTHAYNSGNWALSSDCDSLWLRNSLSNSQAFINLRP